MNFTTDDDVTLYYEDSGSKDAVAVIFAHEFAGEVRRMRILART